MFHNVCHSTHTFLVQTPYTGWVTRVITPDTDIAADNSIDKFQLFTYIKDQIRINDLTLDSCIPNPFAGTVTITRLAVVVKVTLETVSIVEVSQLILEA